METVKKIYEYFEESLSMAFFLGILFMMTLGVFTRYLFTFSFAWNVEFCRYAFVWLTFVGAAYVRGKGSHIKIEILYSWLARRLPAGVHLIIWTLKELIIVGFLVLMIVFGWELAVKSYRFRSQAMQLSQFWLYVSVSVGSLLFLLREVSKAAVEYIRLFGSGGRASRSEGKEAL